MTRKEREASIAAGMIYEPGMSKESLVAALVDLGISSKIAESTAENMMSGGVL